MKRRKAMQKPEKSLWSVLGLIVAVGAVLVYVAADNSVMAQLMTAKPINKGPVSIHAALVQDKVLSGSDGKVAVSLTLTADKIQPPGHRPVQHADLVIVLDRSGSMKGQKINDARQAVLRLIDRLTADDRLALVTYSNGVDTLCPLMPMDDHHRRQVKAAVQRIYSGGGTNLGGGLQRGIQTLMQTPADGRQRKVILISDGLANHGITDPGAWGNMASGAVEHNFCVSTVGVGYDFNEVLMTTIADHGAGSYYFLENPNAFAQVFEKEFESTRNVAASALELRVPLKDGVKLIHAGGYPIENKNGYAVIHPGDLLSGQQRKIYLTYKVPTNKSRNFQLGAHKVQFLKDGTCLQVTGQNDLTLACVADPKAVMASINKEAWGEQVVKEDYNQLKEEVADDIRKGRKEAAISKIQEYEVRTRAVNTAVGSTEVDENLNKDVRILRQSVEDTFAGAPAAVAEKKKQRSKALQYESYQIRRDKK
jgi:Ca-activated chloride channel family protein